MSGRMFSGVSPVTYDQWIKFQDELNGELHAVGCKMILRVGSNSKDQSQLFGDIDLAVDFSQGRDELFEKLQKRFEAKKVGNDIVSLKYPLPSTEGIQLYVQVDVMVGDPHYLRWARAGSTTMGTKAGACRALLLNFITRAYSRLYVKKKDGFYVDQSFPRSGGKELIITSTPDDNDLERGRYALDFGVGLNFIIQTKKGSSGKQLKNWKTIRTIPIAHDPDTIVDYLFRHGNAAMTLSFDGVMHTFKSSTLYVGDDFKRLMILSYLSELEEQIKKAPDAFGDFDIIKKAVLL